jgi:hypothetical protein
LDVAAQDRLAALGQSRDDRGGKGPDTRKRRYAEEQADGKQPQTREAAAKVPNGEAERQSARSCAH